MNYFKQSISEQIWYETYKWETDNSISDTWQRVARAVAKAEKDTLQDIWADKFLDLLQDFKFVPGGRVLSNAGTNLKNTTMINCYVSGFEGKDQDSLPSIYKELTRQAKILASEGGYGINFSVLRPRGSFVHGIGVETGGTIDFMKLWDTSSSVLTAGSGQLKKGNKGKNKIRKGAMMAMLHVWHPSVEEFITAKQQPGVLTKFNMTVLLTDAFMDAVKNHKPWNLEFPDITSSFYETEWDGNLEAWKDKGYTTNIWKTYDDANTLYDLIMTSTYNRNEPGVAFIDRVNSLNNLYYCENINASNPCGEQYLPVNGACNLGSINLTQFITNGKIDYAKLDKYIPIIVRFQDDILDITNFPIKEQRKEAENKRRVGIGYMGYGSALYMLKLSYGSEEALKITEKLVKYVTNTIYQASALLAIEKGCFPLYNAKAFLESKFVNQALTKDTIDLIERHGIRNALLTTCAPTGNTGIVSNNVSGGLEPVISPVYIRTIIVPNPPAEITLPKVDWNSKKFEDCATPWEWAKEGDEHILHYKDNGVLYKFDRSRGLCKEERVEDYAITVDNSIDIDAPYIKTIYNLTPDDHINTMLIFAKYIDSAISKTLNLPNDFSYDDFKSIYMDAYNSGYIKGFTTYREGTMTSILKKASSSSADDRITPKRPKRIQCDVHRVVVKGKQWKVFVGMIDDKPYEIFAGEIESVNLPKSVTSGFIIKNKSSHYSFEYDDEILIDNIAKAFDNKEHDAFARMVSLALRHGVQLKFIIDQLSKSKGSIVDFNKALIIAIKKYVKDGESAGKCPNCGDTLVYVGGCPLCKSCGASKCG